MQRRFSLEISTPFKLTKMFSPRRRFMSDASPCYFRDLGPSTHRQIEFLSIPSLKKKEYWLAREIFNDVPYFHIDTIYRGVVETFRKYWKFITIFWTTLDKKNHSRSISHSGFILGISILCQPNNCDELLSATTTTSPPSSTSPRASSTGELEITYSDKVDLTTPSTLQSTASSVSSSSSTISASASSVTTLKQNTVESLNKTTRRSEVETKTSITSTSTTVTHSLRIDRVEAAANDEMLIDATTSLDGICLPNAEGEQSYSVESIDGDIMVTIISSHQSIHNATDLIKFIVRRVNDIDLLVNGVSIGEQNVFRTLEINI